jgi:hypothetical protein
MERRIDATRCALACSDEVKIDLERDSFSLTSPLVGEVELLLAMRSIVECNSGEGLRSIDRP